ncbi:MAG: ABC-F family ATP-binding cassette domain-containing protein [Pirellulaceae bacterium]|nr:ABC-F family ATP-binding cassette domain-containing protein [Pirellulaceae bacterium]
MVVATISDIIKRYGSEEVLLGAGGEIRSGDRIGLVGPNGCGKTTFLHIVSGKEEADAGTIDIHSSQKVGLLQQQMDTPTHQTVWEFTAEALSELTTLIQEAEAVAAQMAKVQDDESVTRQLGDHYDRLQHEIEQLGGYETDHRIERVLQGLGFSETELQQPVNQLSGGQQSRVLLGKLLLSEPDVLLLDEPSNHLDIQATQWLEEYLSSSRQAMIVVSHDRYLLDRVTNRTWELFQGTIESFPGNFTTYWKQKQQRVETQRRTYERQQAEIARLEDFVRRHHAGQKHSQAEDRRKKLERIERVEPPREIQVPPMAFPAASRAGDIVLRVEHLSKSYEQTLFDDLTFTIQRGEKWGILGPNGSGKTTLLQCITSDVAPDSGRVILGTGVELAYFDQKLTNLDADLDLLEAVRPDGAELTEQQRRDLLATFGLIDDVVHQPVRTLSGGQRNRALLARLSASQANLLFLDEPTNHLDLWARDALERSLNQFDGTLLFVSHDRYFLNRVVDHLLVFDTNRCRIVEGNYEMFLRLSLVRDNGTSAQQRQQEDTKRRTSKSNRPPNHTTKRRRKFPYRKLVDIEKDIENEETQIDNLHQSLLLPEVLRDGQRVKSIRSEIEQRRSELATLYEHWEESVELN